MTAQLRAGIYGRESKGKQKSIDDQITLGIAACRIIGADADNVRIYSDGSSGSRFATKKRDDWAQVVKAIRSGLLDVLLLWESSRGSRDLYDWIGFLNACRDNGVLLYIIGDDEMVDVRKARDYKRMAESGVDAAYESDRTSERTLRGVRATTTRPDGATPHGNTPYGYTRRLRNPDVVNRPVGLPWEEFYVQVPDPYAARIVREIFVRIARNDPINNVANDLNARGIPGPEGGKWHRNTIRRMVRSVTYLGRRMHQGVEYPACWPALVHPATFRAANKVLDEPDRRKSKPGQKRWLLTYLATGPCGGPMHGQPNANNGRRPTYHCQTDGCVGIGVAELDEYVARLVCARLSQPDARHHFLPNDDAAAEAKAEAARLRDKLDEARESYLNDGISAATLAALEQKLLPMIEEAEQRVAEAGASAAIVELVTADDVRKVWDDLPLAGRREVITKVLGRITVGRPVAKITRYSTDEDRIDAAALRVETEWRAMELVA